jgi:hypothetical protein
MLDVPGHHGRDVTFVIRPDQVLVLPRAESARPGQNRIELQLVLARDCGAYVRLQLAGPLDLVAHVTPASFSALGETDRVTAVLPLRGIHVLP